MVNAVRRLGTAGLAALGLGAAACGGGAGGAIVPQSGTVTLLSVQTQVFSPRCALSGCHVTPGAPFGLDLTAGASAAGLINVPSAQLPGLMRVAPGNSADSYLYMKLIDDPRILGDRMPQSGTPLNAADLLLVRTWIDQGAM